MLRYAITDRRRYAGDEAARCDALVTQAARLAARGDIDYLQLREKDLPPAALAALARRILGALRTYSPDPARRPKLLINSRADVALAVRADGVHLPSSSGELTPVQVRSLYVEAGLPAPIIGVSCHTLAEVTALARLAIIRSAGPRSDLTAARNLILFGPVFEKVTADSANPQTATRIISGEGPGKGIDLLRQACAAAAFTPVLALGGITEENAAACLAAGAAGIAAIRLFSL